MHPVQEWFVWFEAGAPVPPLARTATLALGVVVRCAVATLTVSNSRAYRRPD